MKEKRNPLYLFACHLRWRDSRDLEAYKHLVAALDDPDSVVRQVAEALLHRSSPRPRSSPRQFGHDVTRRSSQSASAYEGGSFLHCSGFNFRFQGGGK